MRGALWMPRVHHWIVVNHYDSISSRVHVELDAIGPELDRADKSSDRVLGMGLESAPVGDSLGGIPASRYGQ
jgi:hypothetical protein